MNNNSNNNIPIAQATPATNTNVPSSYETNNNIIPGVISRSEKVTCCADCLHIYSIINEKVALGSLVLSFFFCLSDGRHMRGYTYFLFSQIFGSIVSILLNLNISPAESPRSAIKRYYVSGIATGWQIALTTSFIFFQLALLYDYSEKCTTFKTIDERIFNFAFAYNCDGTYLTLAEIFVFGPITIFRIIGLITQVSKCCLHRNKRRMNTNNNNNDNNAMYQSQFSAPLVGHIMRIDDPEIPVATAGTNRTSNDNNNNNTSSSFVNDILYPHTIVAVNDVPRKHSRKILVLAIIAFWILFIGTSITFFMNDYAEMDGGNCPVVNKTLIPYQINGTTGGTTITSMIFRSKPAKGVEVDHCGWTRWGDQSTCVKYPFNYTYFGQEIMGEAVADRLLPAGGIFSGGTETADNETGSCQTMLGLFSCATYSSRSGDFITLVKNGEIHMNVCPDWCSSLFNACSNTWCDGLKNAEECCNSLNPDPNLYGNADGTWVKMKENKNMPNNGWYSKGHRMMIPSFNLVLILICMLTGMMV